MAVLWKVFCEIYTQSFDFGSEFYKVGIKAKGYRNCLLVCLVDEKAALVLREFTTKELEVTHLLNDSVPTAFLKLM